MAFKDITYRKTFQGSWELSALRDGHLVTRQYMGYNKHESTAQFRNDLCRTYTFYWAPEGCKLATIYAVNLRGAKAQFKRECPVHAKYMGEVYAEVS